MAMPSPDHKTDIGEASFPGLLDPSRKDPLQGEVASYLLPVVLVLQNLLHSTYRVDVESDNNRATVATILPCNERGV